MPEPPQQSQRGKGDHKSRSPVPDGRFPEAGGGGRNRDRGVSGACHRRGGPRGAYAILKRWYRHASAWTPNPSWTDMEMVRGDFHNLYQREEPTPTGLPLDTHVNLAKANGEIPSEAEAEAEVEEAV